MTWELALSIFGTLFGSGGLVMIFMSGRRIGVLEQQISNNVTSLDKLAEEVEGVKSSARNEAGETSKDVFSKHDELRRSTQVAVAASETRMEEKISTIHRRIDAALDTTLARLAEDIADARRRLESTVVGLQGQRVEWDQLKQDIRTLLRAEAIATEATDNIKHSISEHSNKIDTQNEKVAALRADLTRLLRLEVEYDRLKDELTRLQSHTHRG